MNKTSMLLGALALDLRRVAQGYYRGSENMATRFAQEAMKRKADLQGAKLPAYIQKLLKGLDPMLSQSDHKKIAEDALMFSTLFQNAALTQSN